MPRFCDLRRNIFLSRYADLQRAGNMSGVSYLRRHCHLPDYLQPHVARNSNLRWGGDLRGDHNLPQFLYLPFHVNLPRLRHLCGYLDLSEFANLRRSVHLSGIPDLSRYIDLFCDLHPDHGRYTDVSRVDHMCGQFHMS